MGSKPSLSPLIMAKTKRIYVPVSDELIKSIKAISDNSNMSMAQLSSILLNRGWELAIKDSKIEMGLDNKLDLEIRITI